MGRFTFRTLSRGFVCSAVPFPGLDVVNLNIRSVALYDIGICAQNYYENDSGYVLFDILINNVYLLSFANKNYEKKFHFK